MRLDVAGDGVVQRVAVALGLVPSPLVLARKPAG